MTSALLLHMTGYVITNLAAFTAIIAYHNATGAEEMRDFRGMSDRAPLLAASLTVALFSLAGMPLFAGFLTKFIFFQSVADDGYLWLAGVAVVDELHKPLLLPDGDQGDVHLRAGRAGPLPGAAADEGLTVLLSLGVFFVGLYPRHLFEAAQEATKLLFV